MYVVVRIRVEDGEVRSVYSHRETADEESASGETVAKAIDVAMAVTDVVMGMMTP